MTEASALLLQGLRQNTLVAGKTTALRLFADIDVLPAFDRIEATILRPDGSRLAAAWSKNECVVIPNSSVGPSFVVRLFGNLVPWVGTYYIRAQIRSPSGAILAAYTLDRVELLPTKDLRFLVGYMFKADENSGEYHGTFFPTPAWDADVERSMLRLGSMFPVRDGVQSSLNGDLNNGIRYQIGTPCDGYVASYYDCVYQQTRAINASAGDHIDVTIEFRPGLYAPEFNPPGDPNPGGNAGRPPTPYGDLPRAGCVAGRYLEQGIGYVEMTAATFAQEIGHNFGLVPASSPHSDPNDPAHSKDPFIADPDAYDLLNNRLYSVVEDTMCNKYPNGAWSGADKVMFTAFDWEHLREQIAQLPSTGPTGPFIRWQSLEGDDLRPFPAVGKNADGRQEVFVLGSNGVLYHRWERSPRGEWNAWSSLEGHDLQGIFTVAQNADGRLQVFVCGGDGKIYSRHQAVPNGDWAGWMSLGGDQVRDFSVGRNLDGRLQVVAVWSDGALYSTLQIAPNGNWSPWASLGGEALQGAVAIEQNADGRLEAFVVGGDGIVYHQWQTVPSQGPWSGWSNLAHPSLPNVANVAVGRGADGRLYVFFMRTDKSLSYRAQNAPNGGWDGPVDIGGHDLRWPCAVGRNQDGRLEVFVIGGDSQLYNTWQIDPARPDLWSSWVSLGGREIQAGIGVGSSPTRELEVFVIGGDRKLYRGPRG